MNTLTAVRTDVADALTAAGIDAFGFIPSRVNPPVAIISAGTPYVSKGAGNTFADFTISIDIRVVAGQASNEAVTDELDALLVESLEAFSVMDRTWTLSQVSQPFAYEVAGSVYLAADISITVDTEINKEEEN